MTVHRVLVVGGTGLIGGAAALHLADLGHEVTIAGRRPPASGALDRLPFIAGSFLGEDFDDRTLARFDVLVFAAGNDLRQVPSGGDQDKHFHAANTIGVPAFFARAKRTGIGCAVYVGSFYPQVVAPERIAVDSYLRSRKAADEGVRALAEPSFRACSLNAPYVLGKVDGVTSLPIEMIMRYLIEAGDEAWCIPGGSNFISTRAFAQAVAGAIARGEQGMAYLIGDDNWTYEHYFNLLLRGLGRPPIREIRNAPHPALMDEFLYTGRGSTVAYEPDPAMVERLGYERHGTEGTVIEMAPYYAARLKADSEKQRKYEGGIDA